MNNDTKLSELTVGEFKALMRECLQQDMDAAKEVERLRSDFIKARQMDQRLPSPYLNALKIESR